MIAWSPSGKAFYRGTKDGRVKIAIMKGGWYWRTPGPGSYYVGPYDTPMAALVGYVEDQG